MLGEEILYTAGLALVCLYIVTGTDDLIWDCITAFKRIFFKRKKLNLQDLDAVPPKLLAVAIAAWREDNVLGDVINNFIESTHYPRSMYHVFIGVYPNDDATVEVARALAKKHPNVHTIINYLPGPTSKAQNINYVINQIKQFEKEHNWQFASLTLHDSEDVVHPYELKVTNYLLEKHDAIQFPVIPLIELPKFRNFLKNITTCTYADEFAENHFITMFNRCQNGAFVPSAGTGFALSKKILDSFVSDEILPDGHLTEDYMLSLALYLKGIQMYFVLEKVPRITDDNKVVWDYISTRSMFPSTFKTATKQRARWILGITMQSFKFRDLFKHKHLPFAGKYSLYRDQKAKIGNLLALIGYPVIGHFIVSLFVPLIAIFPIYSLSWYLSLVVTVMMVERQIFRSVAIYNVYGMRSVFFACLFPPAIPARIVWGNIVNFISTVKAIKQKLLGNQAKPAKKVKPEPALKTAIAEDQIPPENKKKLAWAKTDHTFLPQDVLRRYHRRLGDVFLEKGYVDTEQLQNALRVAAENKLSIGHSLYDYALISEHQLLTALSNIKHIQYLDPESLNDLQLTSLAPYFDEEILQELYAAPILKTDDGFVFAFCEKSPIFAQTMLHNYYGIKIYAAFASQQTIENAIRKIYANPLNISKAINTVANLYLEGLINYEQVILAYNYKNKTGQTEGEILKFMGLIPDSKSVQSAA